MKGSKKDELLVQRKQQRLINHLILSSVGKQTSENVVFIVQLDFSTIAQELSSEIMSVRSGK